MLWRDEPTPEQLRVRRLLIALGVLAVVAFFVFAVRYVNRGTASDEPTRFADIAPFRTVVPDGHGGWVGEIGPGWAGYGDAAAIARVCAALRERLPAAPDVAVSLLSANGDPVAQCP